ncbi:cysteine synthase A [Paenibacillus sp. VTT E-133280]|uniref:cysteine synthase A n=1 Tax=Paenibacillus sp. VTT E-133280 TaxID=1986222 RepID=UPI000B9FB1EE|nr:cysteine synthase A [Paenibacillus sp. VTT E-133280]OZQ67505.1 cysteine synthase A [Paenibacillus sp. VTT E-133280]
MANIYKSITDLIGNTPLLEISKYSKSQNVEAKILAKLESFNPGGSVKDRIGYAMIKDAEDKGLIHKDSVIIEPTSGNTGIGLAMAATSLGYSLIIVLPDTFSIERRKVMAALGAKLVLTPGAEGMSGALRKAEELAAQTPHAYIPQQFSNPANPEIHRTTTAEEIWRDTDGNVDIFIAGVGSGGTVSGVGEALKAKNPSVHIVAIEPFDSPVLSGGKPSAHGIQGIGANFIPEIYNKEVVDEIFQVKNKDAFNVAREIAKTEGLLVGISSGAAVYTATEIAKRPENKGKTIVVILPDTGERYLTTTLFDINE